MIKKIIFGSVLTIVLSVANVFAQLIHTPEKGSAERTAILDALRVPIEKKLRQKIQFSIDHFKVQGNWAYLDGAPQSVSGGKPNYKGTEYQNALTAGMFDNNVFALLKKSGEKWKVVVYQVGCTDVCYLPWAKDYKAPKTIFPTLD